MVDQKNAIGILWMGGQSCRFQDKSVISQFSDNKIYALLHKKPLFLWAFETLESVVDCCVLSFNSFLQYNHFMEFLDQASLSLPHFDKIIDKPSIPSQGPLQAQLTALQEFKGATKVITLSSDMPFITSRLLNDIIDEVTAISTLGSPNDIIEPLVSAYTTNECMVALNFLSSFPFGRADDLHRSVKSLTLLTISPNYPSDVVSWNRNVNYKQDISELNQLSSLYTNQEPKIDRKKITNSGNNPKRLISILPPDLKHLNQESESMKKSILNSLIQEESYFYGGRYSEFLAKTSGEKKWENYWYSKAAVCYWNETQFWIEENVPFIAFHSVKDCYHCINKGNLQSSWIHDAELLFSKLMKKLNLTKGVE